jgi:hypothetical protein
MTFMDTAPADRRSTPSRRPDSAAGGSLGATVGDFLDKPKDHGGLALSRPIASAVIAAIIIACILLLPQRAGRHPGQHEMAS